MNSLQLFPESTSDRSKPLSARPRGLSQDNWSGGVQPSSRAPVEEVLPKIRSNESYPHAKIQLVDAKTAYENVLQSAGATLPVRDAVDKRIIESVRSGKVAMVSAKVKR